MGRPTGRKAAHLAGLKEKLQLSAEQEAAWNAFAVGAQPGSRSEGMDRKAMRDEFDKLSTPERLDRMQAMAGKRHARMAERAEAIKAFYAQLTPEQQRCSMPRPCLVATTAAITSIAVIPEATVRL